MSSRADICFLGALGVDQQAGVTADDEAEAAVNRVMVTQARRTVVVADATKLGHVGFSRICHLSEIDALLTDREVDPAVVVQRLRDGGLEVVLA